MQRRIEFLNLPPNLPNVEEFSWVSIETLGDRVSTIEWRLKQLVLAKQAFLAS